MKSILSILCIIACLGLTGGNAQAGGKRYSYSNNHCVYKTHTCEVNRCRHKKMGYDACGHCYTYWITVVTYRDYYSNGTTRSYQVTYNG
ncbi:MAG: hypothetical protein KGS60_02800 [Verrucomicrobia bacterium]|nr:hypothetical protein [Verrucomicrobiota bacterium]